MLEKFTKLWDPEIKNTNICWLLSDYREKNRENNYSSYVGRDCYPGKNFKYIINISIKNWIKWIFASFLLLEDKPKVDSKLETDPKFSNMFHVIYQLKIILKKFEKIKTIKWSDFKNSKFRRIFRLNLK